MKKKNYNKLRKIRRISPVFLNVVSLYKFNYKIIAHRFNAKLIKIVSCIYNVYVQPLLLRENYDT